jgi:hypothetical protein
MIRFSYDADTDQHSFAHFAIEGDNTRGYLLLAWHDEKPGEEEREIFQKWFETLGQCMAFCVNEFSILKDRWHAPTAVPPVARFESARRRARDDRPQADA